MRKNLKKTAFTTKKFFVNQTYEWYEIVLPKYYFNYFMTDAPVV